MATTTTTRSRWATYDDELEDSDQTISLLRRAAATASHTQRGSLSLPLSSSSSSRRKPVKSAYFVETTDDEELSRREAASGFTDSTRARSGAGRPAAQRQFTAPSSRGRDGESDRTSRALVAAAAQPSFPLQQARLHIGEIQFPVTRSVLWDRRVLADPIGVSAEQILPRFTVVASALKQVYRLFKDRLASRETADAGESGVLCYLCGDAAALAQAKHVTLTKVAMKQQRKDKWDPSVLWVPVHALAGKNRTLRQSQPQYVSAIASAQQAFADDKTDALTAKLQSALLVASSAVHGAQLDFQLECPAPPLLFRFALIRNLPLLMTPLAASLSRQEFGSGDATRRSGYLTLDRARKAVPVLKTDPLILQQPMVGIWVYGVPLSEEWEQNTVRAQIADPYLYFACLGYIASRTIKEKAELSKNTFLVAIYPTAGSAPQDDRQRHQVSPLPRFFECSFSEHVDSQRPTPIDLYAQQRSCLVGVSSFASDLEFTLGSTPCDEWERARQQLGPTDSDFEQRERSDSSVGGVRSCCKSQALLTIQHQQILENQQRQLHEMQEQIAHLRRLLDATKKMDSGGYHDFKIAPAAGFGAQQGPLDSSELESEVVKPTSVDGGAIDRDTAHPDADDANDVGSQHEDEEKEDDAESSLNLSSISGSSMRSDLSSLSSSLVGKRLKEKFGKPAGGVDRFGESRGSEGSSSAVADTAFADHGDVVVAETQAESRDGGGVKDGSTSETFRVGEVLRAANTNRGGRMAFQTNEEEKAEESDEDEPSQFRDSPLEKLLMPDQYLKQKGAFVDHHRGCFTAPTLDLHSFCVPRIKFAAEPSSGCPSDSEDEEFRLIEQKYKRLLLS